MYVGKPNKCCKESDPEEFLSIFIVPPFPVVLLFQMIVKYWSLGVGGGGGGGGVGGLLMFLKISILQC